MVEQQRQAWHQQQQQQQQAGQDDTVVSSRHHSSKDTTISSCDPASLSIATASGRSVVEYSVVYYPVAKREEFAIDHKT